jgi:hypothetical protein
MQYRHTVIKYKYQLHMIMPFRKISAVYGRCYTIVKYET